ncbi:hypothetical protein HPB52_023082 [Rhipicephalus sanguineus]|uniref:Uncharacterized protein n=1 Tax=Rhipicephalus sanguineus TaxID=34632 RepID=A0A9D4TBV2_RHISA|nr:hypothetical protein HPB52_023082 [Rhipicephalus sanguineus]
MERQAEREAERHMERLRAADKREGRKIAAKSVERQTARIPDGTEKIIMRPGGGLVRLLKYGSGYLADAMLCAAGVSLDAAGEDVFSMNSKQHTILVATINAERKRKYADLKLLMFEGENIEVTTKCRELYQVPYEVKKKQWERKINMRQQQQLQKQQPAGENADGPPRGRSKERRDHEDFCATTDSFPKPEETTEQQHGHSSSRTWGRPGSRPRERSSSRDPAQPWPRKRSQSKDQNSGRGSVPVPATET